MSEATLTESGTVKRHQAGGTAQRELHKEDQQVSSVLPPGESVLMLLLLHLK